MNTDNLIDLFCYDPLTGLIYWKANGKGRVKKRPAGTLLKSGYIGICVGKKRFQAHRIAWIVFYGKEPVDQIDHINGIKTDNRIINLREATNSQNGKNLSLSKRNKSGTKGVCFEKFTKSWRSYIKVNGKYINLGRFKTINDAIIARQNAEKKYFGEWNRT